MQRIPVAIVGATGLAGQDFVAALVNHPYFEIAVLAASARSAGKTYAEALRGPAGELCWYVQDALDDRIAKLPVADASALDPGQVRLVFSAVETAAARELEPRYAAQVPVISTASAFRYEEDVPILVPAVNLDHARLIDRQRRQRGWKGFIAPNPNCTTTGLVITLAPLMRWFGVERAIMTSLQACSGAGRSPGVIGLDIIDNVIPFIAKEEEKVEKETRKILGSLDGGGLRPAPLAVSCTCTRVPVLEGHTETVFLELSRPVTADEIRTAWQEFGSEFVARNYPSSPRHLIRVLDDPFRPQPRLDRNAEDGMTTSVGRLRQDSCFENGWKYVLVSHNTKMGAARGAILVAEHLLGEGYLAG
ncbi:MAG: aspartate-semialdehyde dehydrogenase [Pseudomonadota bacterium]